MAKKRATKRGLKKAAARKGANTGKKGRGVGAGPSGSFAVTTGKGPSSAEIGRSLVELFNDGRPNETEKWWSPSITSVEGEGVNRAWAGRKAVDDKNRGWLADHEVRGGSAEGPYLGASGFAVKFTMEVETKATGQRKRFEEIGVYTVKDGKIVREEFMYGRSTTIENPAATS